MPAFCGPSVIALALVTLVLRSDRRLVPLHLPIAGVACLAFSFVLRTESLSFVGVAVSPIPRGGPACSGWLLPSVCVAVGLGRGRCSGLCCRLCLSTCCSWVLASGALSFFTSDGVALALLVAVSQIFVVGLPSPDGFAFGGA